MGCQGSMIIPQGCLRFGGHGNFYSRFLGISMPPSESCKNAVASLAIGVCCKARTAVLYE